MSEVSSADWVWPLVFGAALFAGIGVLAILAHLTARRERLAGRKSAPHSAPTR